MKSAQLFLVLFIFPLVLSSQTPDLSGLWTGEIKAPAQSLELELDFSPAKKKSWKGTLSVPVQQILQLPLTDLKFETKTGKVSFSVPEIPGDARFKGKVKGDSLNGSWIQSGMMLPTALYRPSADDREEEKAELAAKIQGFKTFVDSLREARHVPGVGIALVLDGKVVFTEGFGYRDLEASLPVDAQTAFCIGSCSKAFTATGLGILADEGKLDWEKPVREYLPDFQLQDPFAQAHTNAIDLMCHRSGLPRHDLSWIGAPETREELFQRLPHLEPSKSFRSTWQYQNYMVMTAGILAGKLHGSSWEALTQEKIFEPLEMERSNCSYAEFHAEKNRTVPYQWDGKAGEYKQLAYRNIDAIGPAGSINSTAEDMANWLLFQTGNGRFKGKEVLSSKEVAFQRLPRIGTGQPAKEPILSPTLYGLGWFTYHYRGLSTINHGGNIDGYSAEVFVLPNEQFGIAVLTNLDRTRFPTAVCLSAADLFLELEDSDWASQLMGLPDVDRPDPEAEKPIAGTVLAHELSDYTGTYHHPGYGTLEIVLEAETLVSKYNGFTEPLSHWHYDVFDLHNTYIDLHQKYNFRTGSDGYIEAVGVPMELTLDDIIFSKLPPPRLSEPDFMARLTGKYDLEVATAEILVEAGRLVVKTNGQPAFNLVPKRGTQYEFEGLNGFSIEFILNQKEEAEEIVVRQPGATLRAKKVK